MENSKTIINTDYYGSTEDHGWINITVYDGWLAMITFGYVDGMPTTESHPADVTAAHDLETIKQFLSGTVNIKPEKCDRIMLKAAGPDNQRPAVHLICGRCSEMPDHLVFMFWEPESKTPYSESVFIREDTMRRALDEYGIKAAGQGLPDNE